MLTLASPAKLNLFLQVVGRRSDGYHDLASLFQVIDLSDTLHFAFHDVDELTCTDSTIPTGASNLVVKATDLFRRKTGHRFNLKVHIEKRIPQQAGLGGGSSNAATTFWALNHLFGQPASLQDLQLWSAEIGSDIPFFLSEGTAFCTGRGEVIRPLSPLSHTKVWIVKPKEGLSTPQVFGRLNLATLPKRHAEEVLQQFIAGEPSYFNDLEEAAISIMPELAVLKSRLLASGFHTVLMTGSGSSLFCVGSANPPDMPGTFVRAAHYINRTPHSWYH
jgi:4-diphosphocytidyl-2-C-methyl-D-erythritol kinase